MPFAPIVGTKIGLQQPSAEDPRDGAYVKACDGAPVVFVGTITVEEVVYWMRTETFNVEAFMCLAEESHISCVVEQAIQGFGFKLLT